MSTQRSGESSGEVSRRTPTESLKKAKAEVLSSIKSGEGKAHLHHIGAKFGTGMDFVPISQRAWSYLPLLWRYSLVSDVLFFGIPGALCLLFPSRALDLHRMTAHAFNWAGPSTGVASNSLLMYVQSVGALMASLSVLVAWGCYTRSYAFGQGWAMFRLALCVCLLYIAALQPGTSWLGMLGRPFMSKLGLADPYTAGSTTYKFLLLPFAHSVGMATLLLMSPDLMQDLWARAPVHLG